MNDAKIATEVDPSPKKNSLLSTILTYFDTAALNSEAVEPRAQVGEIIRWVPYIVLHLGCLGLFWVGWSWVAVGTAVALYFLRMFAITGFYHRYFSHRSFSTSRAVQFIFGVWGNTAVQRGPIWWASQHRQHHAHSDDQEDAHSPAHHGFLWSHMGWLTARDNLVVNERYVRDLLRYPELRFIDRFDTFVPLAFAALLFALGSALNRFAPQLGTTGPQMLVWGFFVSTVVVFHATCTINSLSHIFGKRRFQTGDDSRNNVFLALLTMGEGWHNNHHRYPGSARQGFYWWEIDFTYYGLKCLQWLGLIRNLKRVPDSVLAEGRAPISRMVDQP